MLRVLDLFSGIGGFSLGLERTGHFQTVAFCEIEPFPQAVLRKHWPGVPIYDDVRTLTAERLRTDGITIDVICGGFPCQDISTAGKGAGIEGERSGLWSEIARLTGELRPHYVIVENVAALLNRGLDRVLGDLAKIGYDAEWHCIPASHVGAPHRRDRIWIICYPNDNGPFATKERSGIASGSNGNAKGAQQASESAGSDMQQPYVAYSDSKWESQSQGDFKDFGQWSCDSGENVANPESERCSDGNDRQLQRQATGKINTPSSASRIIHRLETRGWEPEPDVGRVANGIPARVDRLKALGNAVVPQIPQLIGEAIARAEGVA